MAAPNTDVPAAPEEETGRFSLARLGPWRHAVTALVVAIVLGLVWLALSHFAEEVTYQDIAQELASTPWSSIGLAIFATFASFITLSFYDVSALRFIGRPLPYPQVGLTSFFAYAVGNVAGFGPLTGGAVRYHFYAPMGLDAEDIGKIVAFVTATFTLGIASVTGLGLIFVAEDVAAPLRLPPSLLQGAGWATVGLVIFLGVLSALGKEARLFGRVIRLPKPHIFALQIIIAAGDLACSGAALWFLLPDSGMTLPGFIAIYSVAVGLGILSHVPGGIGVFDAVIIAVMGRHMPINQVFGALILYRAIYYLLPLFVSALAASFLTARRIVQGSHSTAIRNAARVAPAVLSALTFCLGAILILSSVTPATDAALGALSGIVPLFVLESAHFLSSVLGLGLLIVARGLAFRLTGAWWIALFAIGAAIVLSLIKAVALIEAGLLVLLLLSLIATRDQFTRPSLLTDQILSPAWLAAIATILVTALAVLFVAYRDVDYVHELWWQFEVSAEAPRSLRALLGISLLAGCIAGWNLLRHARYPATIPTPEDLERIGPIIDGQPQADANLARTGDKSLMFSEDGRAFIMYGARARTWVALFDPIGPQDAWPALIWRFVEAAREAGARAVFYQVAADNLALYADVGLQAFKLGEEARLDLTEFDLVGSRRATLRQTHARGQREGLVFEIVEIADIPAILTDLQRVSDSWLAHHKAREKRFSLGAFSPTYILSQPVAILRHEGRIVAFANLLTTQTREEASIDLMRFEKEAPKIAMEFLFTTLCLHFKAQGFHWFVLGMAPLSGMSRSPAAPLWHRIGRALFEHGERFYNFRGLRAFKTKFSPHWSPRYFAVPGGIEPAIALTDVAALIGGGLKGVITK
ncbi:bifunctional lysylphosphatidylglycerol flippase/synthetase MprF [Terrihabitans sp. B22-R8]|uniref:bifunctional lysylphosphatidylglycerol flippase/synthetase MprF n=1 Tax=Terrihabitans sp. B22-R8 TaxID=3425128 RepID=UPI00403CC72D